VITHNFIIAGCDTDSIAFSKPDGSPFTTIEQEDLLKDLNFQFPEKIHWEHDGIYDKMIVLKAKNYILYQNGKIKKKGSSLKSSKTEKGLRDFMSEIIDCLIFDKTGELISVYHKYVKEVFNVKDISRYSSKKTITSKVLDAERTTEVKILAALEGAQAQMGDKYYMYFALDKSLKIQENWNINAPDHDPEVLLAKLYKTLLIFQNVIDIKLFPKYYLKNKKIREELKKVLDGI
jgi:DNA polymerase elongation subunit (family B)